MKRITAAFISITIFCSFPYQRSTAQNFAPPNTAPFAFRLINAILQQDTSQGNKLISPFSVYLDLCVLYNGAGYATKDSIADALQLRDINIHTLNALCKNMLQVIHLEDNKVQISLARALWFNRKKAALLPSFQTTADTYYYTTVQPLNFNVRTAAVRINNWVDQNSAYKGASTLPRMNPRDFLYFTDAAYFNGDWQSPFEAGEASKDLFYPPGGRAKMVPVMKKEWVTKVYSDTSFTMFEIPYGNGKAFSMYILMPDDPQQAVSELAAILDEGRLSRTLQRMNDQYLQLSLPSWEYPYSIPDMRPALSQLGLGILFDREGNTDFSGMVKGNNGAATGLNSQHNTYIKVNEKGTRVSTVQTGVLPDSAGLRRHRPLVLKVDHPFLYLILEKQRNIVLFAGVVNDPAGR